MRNKKDDTYYRFKSKKCGNCTPSEMIEGKLVIPVMKPIEWEED